MKKQVEHIRADVKKDIRTDKTIIIGFTGPIGSGCTELSKFLGSRNGDFSEFLFHSGYIKDIESNIIEHNIIDNEIKELYKEKSKKEKEIEDIKNKISRHEIKPLSTYINIKNENVKLLNNRLKEVLEKRNYVHSLKYMLLEKYYGNRLRISCSSLIVFELVRNVRNDIKIIYNNNEKVEKVKDIYDEIKVILKDLEKKFNVNSIPDYFQKIYQSIEKYYNHKKDTKDISIKQLDNCFEIVAEIKQGLKTKSLYRELMQDFGDNLRSTGDPYHYIDSEWLKNDGNKQFFLQNNYEIARMIDRLIHFYTNKSEPTTYFYLIDSLRNPMSIRYLRNRYPKFYLISLFTPYEIRENRVIGIDANDEMKKNFSKKDERDQGKSLKGIENNYKQNVRECVLISDIAINNEDELQRDLSGKVSKHESRIFNKLLRYVGLIIDKGCTKPTIEETFMNMAYTMAMKSNCISRKVGAVIASKEGYLVGAGWNDVGEGQISCGLRYIKDLRLPEYERIVESMNIKSNVEQNDAEYYIETFIRKYEEVEPELSENLCFCLKDKMSEFELNKKIEDIYDSETKKNIKTNFYELVQDLPFDVDIRDELEVRFETQINQCADKIKKKVKVKRLEFCKALHAEENAIIQSAKIGGMGIQEGTIYITTFPCELCAKKIQQSGIKEVIYVEPYPKSISEQLFLKEGVKKVKVTQFEGVTAYGYMKLFKPFIDQKERTALELSELYQNL